MVWESTPRFSSSSSIFRAVVVLPEPEGPESSTTGLLSRLLRMRSAARDTRWAYAWSHSSRNSVTSVLILRLIS